MEEEEGGRTIFVGGLAENVTKELLSAAFIPFGDIRTVELPVDRNTGKHRGFGFVEFEESDSARFAIDNMNEAEMFGRIVKTKYANSQVSQNAPSFNKNRPIWEDETYHRYRLAEEGMQTSSKIDEQEDEKNEDNKSNNHN